MPVVGAGSCRQENVSSRSVTEFWSKRGCLNPKLLEGIGGNKAARSPNGAERLGAPRSRSSHNGDRRHFDVRRYAVHREIVCACALAADAELAGRTTIGRRDYHSRSQL